MMLRRMKKERTMMMAPSISSTCSTRTHTGVMSTGVTSGGGPGPSFVHRIHAPASNTLLQSSASNDNAHVRASVSAPPSETENLKPRGDEPNVFNFPSSIFPEYQPLPLVLKAMLGFLSLFTWSRIAVIPPVRVLVSAFVNANASTNAANILNGRNIKFLLKSIVSFIISTMLIQDIFYAPSRIDTAALARNNWLPSKLSCYSTVKTSIPSHILFGHEVDGHGQEPLDMDAMGVHFLEYENESHQHNPDHEHRFDVIYFNHGFGASSLSWLPAIPSLVNKLRGKVGLAHDAPGFGFTDRPQSSGRRGGLVPYSSAGSAALGNTLLASRMSTSANMSADADMDIASTGKNKKVVLFGHSMGCASTLKMALSLPSDVDKTVVLVSPALVGNFPEVGNQGGSDEENPASKVKQSVQELTSSQPSEIRLLIGTFFAALRRVILDPVIIYILRRVVGRKGFWNDGLALAWGNPSLVSDTDAMRFQWPSIGRGWESGLLSFTRSRIASTCAYKGGEMQLLSDVLDSPRTKMVICHGTSDPIVPFSMTKKIIDHFPGRISFIPLEGQGHDPFEERIDNFVNSVVDEIQNQDNANF